MTLEIQIEPLEARVLGVLIEKELTTPDAYPLTLNAITAGANQKNNRDPVLDLLEGEVNGAVQKLLRRGLLGAVHPLGSRVEKFRHNAGPLLRLEPPQLAVLAELLMRGPQQPGELRGRVERMTPCESLERLHQILDPMLASGLVVRLDPAPGTRSERYGQRLAPDTHPVHAHAGAAAPSRSSPTAPAPVARSLGAPHAGPGGPGGSSGSSGGFAPPASPAAARDARVGPLEEKVAEQEKRIAELDATVARLRRQLEQLAWQLGKKLEI